MHYVCDADKGWDSARLALLLAMQIIGTKERKQQGAFVHTEILQNEILWAS